LNGATDLNTNRQSTPEPEGQDELVRTVRRVTWIGLLGNLGISGIKFALGVVGSSQALVADAVHSLSDLITDLAILVGVRFWSSPPDEGHPYGHGRIESMVTVGIGTVLALAALGIGYGGLRTILAGAAAQPRLIALVGAVLSILVKEVLYQWTVRVGTRARSPALVANAWHHRSDAISSIPVVVAITAATIRAEWAVVDAVGAVVVAVFILRVAWKILHPSLMELSDGSAPPDVRAAIPMIAASMPGIHEVHDVRTRRAGSKVLVDLHAVVDGDLRLKDAHEVGERLRKRILSDIPEVEGVMVHLDPDPPA
jgi:cation diffusion facilitator family transporter